MEKIDFVIIGLAVIDLALISVIISEHTSYIKLKNNLDACYRASCSIPNAYDLAVFGKNFQLNEANPTISISSSISTSKYAPFTIPANEPQQSQLPSNMGVFPAPNYPKLGVPYPLKVIK